LEITNTLDPGFHRGDEYSVIFSQLPFAKGGLGGIKLYRKSFEKFFENDINTEGIK